MIWKQTDTWEQRQKQIQTECDYEAPESASLPEVQEQVKLRTCRLQACLLEMTRARGGKNRFGGSWPRLTLLILYSNSASVVGCAVAQS